VKVTPRRLALAAACAGAVVAPMAVGTVSGVAGDLTSFVVRFLTALVAVVLLLRTRPTGHRAPVAPARLFAVALLVGAAAAFAAVLSAAGIGSRAFADALYLMHVPWAAVGLMLMPVADARAGARVRGLLDGLVAAAALAFILHLLVPPLRDGAGLPIVALAVADVFVLATALSLVPRVAPELRRYLFLTSGGLVLIGAANLQKAIALTEGPVSSHGLRTAVVEVGVLLVAFAAARPVCPDDRPHDWRWSALVPFLPTAVAVLIVAELFLRGKPFEHGVGLALLNAAVLLLRQGVASWDSAHLLERLRQREHAYRDQALEDPLTGLPNRRAFVQAAQDALAGGAPVTLLLVDCDDFKAVNDTQGHDAGDAVLRHVGDQMRRAVGDRGCVARLGGDEFGVLLHLEPREAAMVARQLRAAAGTPLETGCRRTTPTVSVGGAAARPAADDVSSLLAHADVALYRAKDRQSPRTVVLDDAGRREAAGQLRLRDDVAAPDLTQFSVSYQPVFRGSDGALHGVEALLRWEHPVLGTVSPALFIPLAEQTGSIGVLGDFVLSESLQQLARWQEAFPGSRLRLGVNVSPHQLSDSTFAGRALGLLARHGVSPQQLVVEITEQAFVSDLEPMAAVAHRLRAAGVSVAVDDFGTGYASLRYLERIPTDVLKIDRAYIATITSSPSALALVRGVLALVRELGLQSTAEGVETPEQLALLRELGCDVVQGYLLARPGGPEAVSALLAAAEASLPLARSPLVLPAR
jgi:diguanylate cyclase (GGDEF)-like protein